MQGPSELVIDQPETMGNVNTCVKCPEAGITLQELVRRASTGQKGLLEKLIQQKIKLGSTHNHSGAVALLLEVLNESLEGSCVDVLVSKCSRAHWSL